MPAAANTENRAVLALCIGSLMVFANLYVPQPLLPAFARHFLLSELEASKILTVSTFALGISLLIHGPLSDVLGRKPIMTTTLCGITLTTIALACADEFNQILWLRGLQGFFMGGLPAVAVAYLGEELKAKSLVGAIGVYISANSLGGIFGRVVGGITGQLLDWQSVFIVLAAINGLVTLWFYFALPKSRNYTPSSLGFRNLFRPLWLHLRTPQILLAYIMGGLNFMIFLNEYNYIIFLLADAPYHLPASLLGMLFLTYLSGSVASVISGLSKNQLSINVRILVGTAIIICGTLITSISSLTAIICGFCINAFGFFLAHSSLTALVNVKAVQAKASASSLYLFFYYCGASVGNLYLDPFWHWQKWNGIVVGSVFALAISVGIGFYMRKLENQLAQTEFPLVQEKL